MSILTEEEWNFLYESLVQWSGNKLGQTTNNNDVVLFIAGVAFLILYLVFSAWTEMETKLPWKRNRGLHKKPVSL
ncbi:MAG: hypothetical protein QNJ53_04140 [Pleurocapsa sp. MO_192.B19]|nr:hypothetical protein [Pleurocapsa sp. MO_192.B19]